LKNPTTDEPIKRQRKIRKRFARWKVTWISSFFLKIISNYIKHIVKLRIHFLSGERISRLETKNATNDLNLVFLFPLYSFLEIVRSRRKKN